MSEKKYYWLKLEKDFFKQKEIKKLRKVAGGDTLTIIYLKMALLSLENEGVLIYEGIEEEFSQELSLELDEEVENINLVLAYLNKHNMIEQHGEDFYLNRIPEMTGKETSAAKRMRISRVRKKDLECNNVTNVLQVVTKSYTEKEKEKELDKELDKEKENKTSIEKHLYFENLELNDIFVEFLELRKSLKAKNTERAVKLLINKLEGYEDGEKILVIEQSIMNSWKSLFDIKNKDKKNIVKKEDDDEWGI